MSNIPNISALSVRKFAGEQNYAGGKKNFRSGLLYDLRKQGMVLKGDYGLCNGTKGRKHGD